MCRSIHEIKPCICAVGISTRWFGITCIGPRATPHGSSHPLTSTSISTWTVATSFQTARFHKTIWGQVGMPSHDLKTKLQRKFGAFLSNDFTSLVLQWQFGDFFPKARGASPGALGATGHRGGLAEVRLQRPRGDAWWHWLKDLDPVGVVNHYRVPDRDPLAQTFDDKLVADAPLLKQAILRLARWRLLHRGVRRICRSAWGNRTPWRRCPNTSTTSIWRTTPGGIGSRTSTPKRSVPL